MHTRGLGWGGAAALALVLLSPACAGTRAPTPPEPPASAARPLLGHPAPAFRRSTLDGGSFDTVAATGNTLVVDFFAGYCVPCQRSLPALEALHRWRPDLAVVGVSLDADPVTARRQVARHRLTFPV